ncbi:TrkH family potassium uptake protein [Altererythrobacter aurantiacus]|uniref:TrkH family potassium uptake protein n=1 Tax=Parapontixanthobacter aurantiacus TaxID=1463599 RepID=A0A844ZC39_9SPHN|nr:potassium transporter TrkG [Parapontixanthobacter aurantiacus]MXO84832.1 TrkH family potassium uptake protein [Parapontixanthobacter aurantiacus]
MRGLRDPIRLIPVLFLCAIVVGTILLSLPFATTSGVHAPFLTALFTATSAVAVTGLIVVDTPTYWSVFGQVSILLMFQIGGFGIMTAATLFGLMVGRGVGLRERMATQVERNRLETGDAASVLRLIFAVTLTVEALVAIILAARLMLAYDMPAGNALWHGVFHSVSAFNNAGFSVNSDSLIGYQTDVYILGPIMFTVVLTALGFPVLQDIRTTRLRWRRWTLHTKVTVAGTVALLLVGFLSILASEWYNPGTLGPMDVGGKVLNASFHSVMPRTAGFNSLDVSAFHDETLMVNFILMFVGGGSAGTAGGIKVTTFFVLFAIVLSEVLGRRDAGLFGRRFGKEIERQALSVTVLSASLIFVATTYIASISPLPLDDILFECISAFSTVGLSTGITADLPPSAQLVIAALMFIGRVGTITVATALALGGRERPYRYPEESPIVG